MAPDPTTDPAVDAAALRELVEAAVELASDDGGPRFNERYAAFGERLTALGWGRVYPMVAARFLVEFVAPLLDAYDRQATALAQGRTFTDHIDIVFDGPPGHESGRFVEVEDSNGASIRAGEWLDHGEYWVLRIPYGHRTFTADDVDRAAEALYRRSSQFEGTPWSNLHHSFQAVYTSTAIAALSQVGTVAAPGEPE